MQPQSTQPGVYVCLCMCVCVCVWGPGLGGGQGVGGWVDKYHSTGHRCLSGLTATAPTLTTRRDLGPLPRHHRESTWNKVAFFLSRSLISDCTEMCCDWQSVTTRGVAGVGSQGGRRVCYGVCYDVEAVSLLSVLQYRGCFYHIST